MFLSYENKKSVEEILNKSFNSDYSVEGKGNCENKLFFGDNFDALNILIHDFNLKGKVDLVYIDPPFSTNNIFRVGEKIGRAHV